MSEQLATSIFHQLHQTVRLLNKRMNRILEPFGLYTAEWPILLLLQVSPLTQVELSERLHIEPPAVSKTLCNLERKGLLTRRPGHDRRQKLVHLTAAGRHVYETCRQQVEPEKQLLLACLSPEAGGQLLYLLKQVQAGAISLPPHAEESPDEFV